MLLKEYRRMHHLTQEDVAKVLGIPKKTYQNYEREVREADSDVLCQLADYYKISLDELVGRQTAPQLTDDEAARDVDRLAAIFYSLDKKGRAVLLDVAMSLEKNILEEK